MSASHMARTEMGGLGTEAGDGKEEESERESREGKDEERREE